MRILGKLSSIGLGTFGGYEAIEAAKDIATNVSVDMAQVTTDAAVHATNTVAVGGAVESLLQLIGSLAITFISGWIRDKFFTKKVKTN